MAVMRPSVIVAFALLPMGLVAAQDQTMPPDPSVTALLAVSGKGVQIYRCQTQQGGTGWVFVAPEATLYAGSEAVGTHGAGPIWRWKDGSAVTGKLLVSQPAPDRGSIPWLLLAAMPAADSKVDGTLAHVVYVRRSDTQSGSAPATGCSQASLNALARVSYTATYTFYSRAPQPQKTAH